MNRFNPHNVVADFERAVAEYTGAPYAVAVNSCTMALLLALAWCKQQRTSMPAEASPRVDCPKRTYISVPMSIVHAGYTPCFVNLDWVGAYRLSPTPVVDSARRFTKGMYKAGEMQCTSHHWTKILGVQQGGMILHDNEQADAWLRRMRFDGRTAGVTPMDDDIREIGWHCYMSPEVAAEGLVRLSFLPDDNPDLPNDDYPDLSEKTAFYYFPRRE